VKIASLREGKGFCIRDLAAAARPACGWRRATTPTAWAATSVHGAARWCASAWGAWRRPPTAEIKARCSRFAPVPPRKAQAPRLAQLGTRMIRPLAAAAWATVATCPPSEGSSEPQCPPARVRLANQGFKQALVGRTAVISLPTGRLLPVVDGREASDHAIRRLTRPCTTSIAIVTNIYPFSTT
jgi:hypothetical protein